MDAYFEKCGTRQMSCKLRVPFCLISMVVFLGFSISPYADEVEIYGANPLYCSSGYIISDSDRRYLTESDVRGFSIKEINYAKNEIYARRGRKFLSPELQSYFDRKDWYVGIYEPNDFDINYAAALLNNYEKVNAEFLSNVEYSMDPNGYQLDSEEAIQTQKQEFVAYDSILDEYKSALGENFSNMTEYQFIPSYFDPFFSFYQGEKIYYALYDFFDDGLPELVISVYREATEYYDAFYTIVDAYGTDGAVVRKLDDGYTGSFITYRFCENNILEAHWVSGGLSAGGSAYYQLSANTAAGEKIEEIGHTGGGECYRYDLSNPDEQIWIQSFEFDEIVNSYHVIEDIPFEWTRLRSLYEL